MNGDSKLMMMAGFGVLLIEDYQGRARARNEVNRTKVRATKKRCLASELISITPRSLEVRVR